MTTTVEKTRQKQPHAIYKVANGDRVPGATTVLGVLDKPALVSWAWGLGKQGIDWRSYRDALADVGTICHLMVECDLRGETPNLRDFTAADIELAQNAYRSWEAWKRGRVIEPLLMEAPLVSEMHRYGGTLDFYGKIDGVFTLLDFKTSKAIYPEHLTQLIAYRHLLEEGGYPVQESRILRIGRTEDESFEDCLVSTKLDEHWQLFLRCRDIYELQKQLNKKA